MHISVLLNESIDLLNIKEDGIYVDATLGYGGHSSEILKKLKNGHLYSFDQDIDAIKEADKKLKKINSNYTIIKSNIKNMKEELKKIGVSKVDGILFDLGVSSPQLDNPERGFSYHNDSKLDMRMDKNSDFSAYNVVNEYSEDKLIDILYKFGEEKFAKKIAKNIVNKRKEKNIETTLELAEIIKNSYPEKLRREKHPARQTFQAIRIEVNHELDILYDSIKDAASLLKKDGILAVITFHSLEDRIIKNIFKELTELDDLVKGLPVVPEEYKKDYILLTKKPIIPSSLEVEKNNRSRSSKLRAIKRIGE